VSDDGADLVMERIEGPSMVAALERAPWTVLRQGDVLAELHQRLHDVAPPDFLGPAPVGEGNAVVHLDLHPLNVIVGAKGPVVIDWTSACLGDGAVDVALAWVLMSAGEIPVGPVMAKMLSWGRGLLVKRFLRHFDRAGVVRQLRDVVSWKVNDPHMSPREVETMWRIVQHAEAGA
jgi:aminoglycoside phosphotransferase (APT) family kinase protein